MIWAVFFGCLGSMPINEKNGSIVTYISQQRTKEIFK